MSKLKEKNIIDYIAKNNDVTIIFNEIRDDDRTINKVAKFLENQNNLKTTNFNTVIAYIENTIQCKTAIILDYFGEKALKDCGICDYCLNKNKSKIDEQSLAKKIVQLLEMQEMSSREIEKLTKHKTKDVVLTIQNLLENNKIKILSNNKYGLKN